MCPDNLYLWEHNQEFDSKICHKTCHRRKTLSYIMSLRDTFPHFQIKRDKAPSIKSFIVKWFYYTKFNNMNFIWLIKTFYRLSSEITFHVLRDSWISCKEQWKSCLKALIFFVSFFVNWNVIICVWTKILRLPRTIKMHQPSYHHVLRTVLQSFSYIWCLE